MLLPLVGAAGVLGPEQKIIKSILITAQWFNCRTPLRTFSDKTIFLYIFALTSYRKKKKNNRKRDRDSKGVFFTTTMIA